MFSKLNQQVNTIAISGMTKISGAKPKTWKKVYVSASIVGFLLITMSVTVFAAPAAVTIDTIWPTIKTGLSWIGGAVAAFGGITLGLAIKDSDASGKQQGLLTLAGGGIVTLICQAI